LWLVVGEVTMTAWSFVPWVAAFALAAGLGALGWLTDLKSRRRRDR
jgi:hypothetical protein